MAGLVKPVALSLGQDRGRYLGRYRSLPFLRERLDGRLDGFLCCFGAWCLRRRVKSVAV
jgi:hypothetical protein